MFSVMFSRRAATSLFVRAFNTGNRARLVSQRIDSRYNSASPTRWLSTAGVARVDEDLDAALDTLLGSAFDEAEDPRDLKNEEHMKDSRPIPKNLVEEVSYRAFHFSLILKKKNFIKFGWRAFFFPLLAFVKSIYSHETYLPIYFNHDF